MSEGLEIKGSLVNFLLGKAPKENYLKCDVCESNELLLVERMINDKRIYVCDTCSRRIPRVDFYNPETDDYIVFE